jgi:hypothetical protein
VRETVIIIIRPPAWQTLAQAIDERRPVRARYHGAERILCPHALGWTKGRPKVLAYQVGGTTSRGTLPTDPRQRWRSMFLDEIEAPIITDGRWQPPTTTAATSTASITSRSRSTSKPAPESLK